jgi:mannose-6-phosphate isomerase
MEAYPLKFDDILLDKIWGGDGLGIRLGKKVAAGARVGESWEVSPHRSVPGRVKNGPWKGRLLSEIIPDFPLLIKFIDARDTLSIQVHPDDAYAGKHENDRGKTEAWHVVHAEKGARMICGLKQGATLENIRKGALEGGLEQWLNEFPVRAGDTVFVPAGTVHAIEKGTLLYEVQEASDVTYRLYDWGRMDEAGKPRALHVEQSLKVLDKNDFVDHRTRPAPLPVAGGQRTVLAACGYFVLEKLAAEGRMERPLENGFEVLSVLSGNGNVYYEGGRENVAPGETILLPAGLKSYTLLPESPRVEALISWAPGSAEKAKQALLRLGLPEKDLKNLGGLS